MVRMKPRRALNKILAPLPVVQREVKQVAEGIGAKASTDLATHRDDSDNRHHEIEVKKNPKRKYGFLDYEISMIGPAAIALEFGHKDAKTGRWVPGVYIIMRASGLV